MRIRRLELTGFKSFSERTVFQFAPGISCIVGPNGCGKSNVIDAIRWILGEQNARRLRGQGMDDIIFGGSKSSSATGVAEATLVLDNREGQLGERFANFAEVEVGRRLYRDGESLYLLNGTRCRLKDVTDLFMDTGVGARACSIIEQGRVVGLISSRPEDRRALLEEAAGIVGYKARRHEAQRRLDSTEQNLLRVGDLATELKRQMNSLRRQASKANRFRTLQAYRKESEILLILAETRQRVDHFREWNDRLADLQGNRDELRRQEGDVEVRLGAQRDNLRNGSAAVDDLKERQAHLRADAQGKEREREFATREILRLTQRLEGLAEEVGDSEARSRLLAQEEEQLLHEEETRQRDLLTRVEQQQAHDVEMSRLDTAVKQAVTELDRMKGDREDGVSTVTRLRAELAGAEHRLRDHEARSEGLERERGEATTHLEQCRERQATLEEQAGELKAEAAARRSLLVDLEEELAGRHGAWAAMMTAIDEMAKLIREREAREQSLHEVLERFEGFGQGVREVMRRRDEGDESILGTVADLLEVSPQYEQAIEAALGAAIQHVLVQTQDDGVVMLEHLQVKEAGRTSFLPSDELRVPDPSARVRGKGVVAAALDVVRVPEEHQRLAQLLLGDVTVVENLRDALRVFKRNPVEQRYVTLTGELVEASGAVTGGARVEGGILGHKRELRQVAAELADLRAQEAEARAARDEISRAMDEISQRRTGVQTDIHALDVRGAGLDSDIQGANRDVGVATRRIAAVDDELGRLAPARIELEATLRRVRGALEEAEAKRMAMLEQLAGLEGRVQELRETRDDRRNEAFEARLEATAARERLEGVRLRLAQIAANREDVRSKIESEHAERLRTQRLVQEHEKKVVALTAELEACARTLEAAGQELEQAIQHREKVRGEGQDLEKALRQLSSHKAELEAKIQEASNEVAVLDTKIGHLGDTLREDFDLHLKGLFARLEEHREVKVGLRGSLPRPLDDDPDGGDADETEEATQGFTVVYSWDQLLDDAGLEQRRQKLRKVRRDLDGIGEINMGAPEAYERVKGEFGELEGQMNDLESSIEQIRKGIAKLNRTSKRRFAEAFEEVNKHFQDLYPRLNGGGKAFLALTDPTQLLDTGVEVNVQPPGKKLKAMGLLSGGEKAMAAISLLFAVFLYRPSPFCLLDEVDAELDEANVGRVTQLLREMRDRTQFVIISHKRHTMESADVLFGVTMEQAGVSKLVTVKLEDVA